MKKILFTSLLVCMVCSCSGNKQSAQTAPAEPEVPTAALKSKLAYLVDSKKFAVGHHDDPVYGHAWKYEADSSDVKAVTGDYPAVFDWDLGLIEWGTDKQLDGVPFDLIKENIKKQNAAGGFNTISWHARNPRGGDAWNIDKDAAKGVVKECTTPGTALNDTLKVWLGRAAEFIGSLRDEQGQRIPVVFRPWHEHTGSWFWWGADHCTAGDYRNLWKLTREVFDEKGIDNVLWAYSPGSEPKTAAEYLDRYPGDEYVDIMGFDTYCFGDTDKMSDYVATLQSSLTLVNDVASKHDKIPVIAETGYEGIPYDKWYTEIFYEAVKDYPFAYVVFWRNAWDKPEHYYTPYPGHPAAADFKAFKDQPRTVFLKDMQ